MMDRAALRLIFLGVFLILATSDPVKKKQNVDIYSFYINSTVTSRYATTVITSRVANKLNESQEIQFEVKIPKNAFISKFRMTIEGKTYDGVVKEKEAAQQQYSQAVSRGQSAGLVRSVGRTLEDFKTSVTVAAFSKVTFELTYEELLKRRLGKYELLINAQPMQPVADFKMDVHIQEKPGISFLEVKGDLSTGDLADAIKTTRADKDAWVTFYPSRDQQTKCKSCGENGLSGDLLIAYDVERQNPKGEVMVSNGYFVHYFAPSDVPHIPKNVVFIIDQSGSMHGRKMDQTRLALLRILSDLDEDDHFGLITFDSEVSLWKRELLRATEENLENAKSFVKEIRDRGATDINAAVLAGVDMISRHPREGTASILILLTDGDPTSGETNKEKIMANVKEAIGTKFPLYCLGFGYDVNFDFLTTMSLENSGVARRIYEDSDADLQLQGFYEEVAVPLLTEIQLKYPGGTNLTKTSFSLYFNGSEIVVSGQITDNSVESFTTQVIAVSKGSNVTYQDTIMTKEPSDVPPEDEDFMQRLWAYLTVKQLLERQVLLKGQEKEDEKKEALRLSLKYQFVTPLTSMVVTKPQEGDVEVADKPKEGEAPHRPPVRKFQHTTHLLSSKHFKLQDAVPSFALRLSDDVRPAAGRMLPVPSIVSVHSNRFLLPVVGQSKPLCEWRIHNWTKRIPSNCLTLQHQPSSDNKHNIY
ncbi:inter-alpha-trypsin inhibitor heavy chain H3-like [Puntigrus tetrazona]|uniref:inter-alpha-trypsin inhibitor heavy chain H3-like n=1 Tax=Puntigrus tetrazona TaxID=1606681 RepID=UPI001C8ACAB6|nr:inter-alpha-trypsin inhibitor heavy chain H3-like [Puntigrus tetrazona]